MAEKRFAIVFYRTASGTEPVRDWLKELDEADRKILGKDLLKIEIGFPIGMPLCRPLGDGLWESRSNLTNGRIAQVIFWIKDANMIALNGFIKKTQKTPQQEIELAQKRKKEIGL